ncbi:PRMT5 isoform 6 [Pongo abelii]|uniref:PRMT5 isoform 6 n=1 Tax=Pongo abelii TaxID=9601 RepID=A0A2J8TS10_PONAB|nr:PRMT5 isoform 6 [Pongo abelii]
MAAMAVGGAGGSRVSSGRDLNCVPEIADTLGAVAKQGLEYANCGKAFSMDSSRLKSGEDSQEFRGGHVAGAEFWCIFGSSSFPAAP